MKITANSNQSVVKKESKTPASSLEKQPIDKSKKILEKQESVTSNPSAQNIKDINTNIGRLQVAQTTLQSIESNVKKVIELIKTNAEEEEQTGKQDDQKAVLDLKKKIESTLKKATFDGQNVFSTSIGDSKGRVIFDASQLNSKLLDSDAQKFYDVLKNRQTQAKDAIQTLQEDAQANTDKLAAKASNNQNTESTDNSFLKKFSSLFRVSHDTSKLDAQRVQELLS